MVDNEDDVTDKDRYNRFSEDWRYHHRLIWEIPSISSAIFIGILTISYLSLDFLLRAAALGVGAALILGLTFAARKHRFGADLRTNFLYDLARDKDRFPLRSSEGLRYLEGKEAGQYEKAKEEWNSKYKTWYERLRHFQERPQESKRRLKFYIRTSSEVNLIWFMFLTAVLLSALCISEVIRTAYRLGALLREELPILEMLENITGGNPVIKEIINVTP